MKEIKECIKNVISCEREGKGIRYRDFKSG